MAYGIGFVLYDQMRDTGFKIAEFTITLGGYFMKYFPASWQIDQNVPIINHKIKF